MRVCSSQGYSHLDCYLKGVRVRVRVNPSVWAETRQAGARPSTFGHARLGLHIGRCKILFHFNRGLCAESQSSFLVSLFTRISHTIALLLHDYCAIYNLPPTPRVYAIRHTLLVMTISCKGHISHDIRLGRSAPNLGFTQAVRFPVISAWHHGIQYMHYVDAIYI